MTLLCVTTWLSIAQKRYTLQSPPSATPWGAQLVCHRLHSIPDIPIVNRVDATSKCWSKGPPSCWRLINSTGCISVSMCISIWYIVFDKTNIDLQFNQEMDVNVDLAGNSNLHSWSKHQHPTVECACWRVCLYSCVSMYFTCYKHLLALYQTLCSHASILNSLPICSYILYDSIGCSTKQIKKRRNGCWSSRMYISAKDIWFLRSFL